MKKLNEATNLEDDNLLEAHTSLKEESPDEHTKWKWPALWDSRLELDDITEPIMQNFFLKLLKNSLLMSWNGCP